MIIKPRIRGFVCLTAHPAGCRKHVQNQIDYVKCRGPITNGPKKVLVIGGSTGYGLGSRIAAAFGSGASTLSVFFEKEPTEKKTATAGWYNSVAFDQIAGEAGLNVYSINGDAFSDAVKQEVIQKAKEGFGPFDLVVYSVAAPRRTHPKTGYVAKSVLKPIGEVYEGKTINTDKDEVHDIRIEPATQQEIEDTIMVMGGEDWEMWMKALAENDCLAEGCKTVAYTYIGPKLTWPIYWNGTIGKAKEDLDITSKRLNKLLAPLGGASYVSVMKAIVTQASSAIPVVPLYISALFKIMKANGTHEGPVEQADRMFRERLYSRTTPADNAGRLRLDDWEMAPEVQAEIDQVWPQITTENIFELTDYAGYKTDFLKLFGFGLDGVDYDADISPIL